MSIPDQISVPQNPSSLLFHSFAAEVEYPTSRSPFFVRTTAGSNHFAFNDATTSKQPFTGPAQTDLPRNVPTTDWWSSGFELDKLSEDFAPWNSSQDLGIDGFGHANDDGPPGRDADSMQNMLCYPVTVTDTRSAFSGP